MDDLAEAGEGPNTVNNASPLAADLELLAHLRRDLDNVEVALERIDAGTYGRCEACGQPVPDEALSESPAERMCALHQRAEG